MNGPAVFAGPFIFSVASKNPSAAYSTLTTLTEYYSR
jgi:hypothetical protein